MEIATVLTALFVCISIPLPVYAQAASRAASVPHLELRGNATQLIVDDKPFLVLGGELHNSSSSSLAYMNALWPRLAAMHLNTVLTPVSWELIEPREGSFDFTTVDGLIDGARRNSLRLVFLWFGSWKNTYSSYVPEWVKRDTERFPRVQTADGRGTERLSPFSQENQKADARAFAALMRHIKQKDADIHTVIMIQVENEVGVIPEARDHSPVADKAFSSPVPAELMLWLNQHKASLNPEFRAAWETAGDEKSGKWEEVFGKIPLTEDLFMAWHYARYTGAVAAAGKQEYALPMFTNAALIRPNYQPGQYNSGGPLPHSLDVWRAGAPALDFFSPDIYFENFAEWSQRYHRKGNPLFIPEAIGGAAAAANALYAIGQLQAIGISPFGIDGPAIGRAQDKPDEVNAPLIASFAVLRELSPLILEKQADGKIAALLLEGEGQRAGRVSLGYYTFSAVRSNPADPEKRGAAMLLQTGPDEYIVAGSGDLTVSFSPNTPGPPIAGIASIDEQVLEGGKWIQGRRLNGDENGQGQLLRLERSRPGVIFRVRLYRYR
jgi:hypothetical protein